jgi:hypothetical protein
MSYSASARRPSGSTLETVVALKRVPLVHVTVHEDGAFIVVGTDATSHACERIVAGALRARAVERFPGLRDVIAEPPALLRAGGQIASRRRTPYELGRRTEDLEPLTDGELEIV